MGHLKLTMCRFLAIFVVLAISSCVGIKTKELPVQVVLLAGQSNMEGAGNYSELNAEIRAKIDHINTLGDRIRFSDKGVAIGKLIPSVPHEQKKDKYGMDHYFGPEMLMALTLHEKYPHRKFLFLKSAVGGTSLHRDWNPDWDVSMVNEKVPEMKRDLYAKSLVHFKSGLADLEALDEPYEIVGFAWFQGEGDSKVKDIGLAYQANLTELIRRYRNEFSAAEMAIVAGQVNMRASKQRLGTEEVRNGIVQFAEEDGNAAVIKTVPAPPWNDYPKYPDQIHYNTEGHTRMGKAMGEAMIALWEAEN